LGVPTEDLPTDTGHTGTGGDASFANGHPEKLIDLGYRSVHLMTVKAKAIIGAFYGNGPRFSYWNGCSTGGKQGLTEAQRYPDDYNGIAEGDPASYWTHLMFGIMWPAEVLKDNDVPREKFMLLHKAVLEACDKLDGLQDGILEDPRVCRFDPKALECAGPDAPTCLTPAQVESVRKLYAGAKSPRTSAQIFPGLELGSELTWHGQAGSIPVTYFKYVLFKNPDWEWQTLNFDQDLALADRLHANILNATNPDLKAFKAHNGKLLMYHGWNDTVIVPGVSVDYYNSVLKKMGGAAKTQDFVRLFMIPAMGHCQGGPAPDTFDKVGVLEQWVEKGVAPDKIMASHRSQGAVDMTRPLCPYPQVARWKGSGSTNDAENFACVNPSDKAVK
jgi:feruloyl esterase